MGPQPAWQARCAPWSGHGTISGRDHKDGSVHLGSTGYHVLHVISMPWAVNVGVVAIGRCVLLVRSSDGDAPLTLLRSVVYLVEGDLAVGRIVWDLLGQDPGYGRSQGGLAVIDVTYGADVEVRLGAHGRRVTEHLGERHHRADDLPAAAGVHTLYVASPRREVAHHVAHELLGHDDLDIHNGLEQNWVGPLERLFDGHRTSDLECHLGRVDLVVRTVDKLDLDIDHGVASDNAGIQRLPDTLVHARDVLSRDDTADDLVVELVTCLVVVLGVDDRVSVLAPATRLPHEPAFDALHALADGLAVSDLRTADVRVNPELAQ